MMPDFFSKDPSEEFEALKEQILKKTKSKGNVSKKTKDKSKSERGGSAVCFVCGQSFKKPYDLKVHMVTHTGDKPYSCELCPTRFAFKNGVARHMKTVHASDKQICPECGKGFTQKSSLETHIKIVHLGIRNEKKNYFCEDCGKSFIRSKFVIHEKRCPFKKAMMGAEEGTPETLEKNTTVSERMSCLWEADDKRR